MTTVKRFEDLHVWQSAREFVKLMYRFTNQEKFVRDFALKDQIRRAASSIMHNIAEGFGAGSDSEFIRFLGYARRSATETQSQLYIALDEEYITKAQFDDVYARSTQILKQINSLIGYLDNSRKNNHRTIKEAQANYSIEIPDHSDQ
ncbi:MAG: four helix bundle protein [Chloroflexi bacterium]|nr:four helix bundle protein [Chloroflexota bacterium]MCL5611456.1 four helix bundle protein [Chloroflexota bacterium]